MVMIIFTGNLHNNHYVERQLHPNFHKVPRKQVIEFLKFSVKKGDRVENFSILLFAISWNLFLTQYI